MSVVSFLYESDVFLLWRGFESHVGRVVLVGLIERVAVFRCEALNLILHLLEDGALLLNLALRFINLVSETINESICLDALRV